MPDDVKKAVYDGAREIAQCMKEACERATMGKHVGNIIDLADNGAPDILTSGFDMENEKMEF